MTKPTPDAGPSAGHHVLAWFVALSFSGILIWELGMVFHTMSEKMSFHLADMF